MKGVQKMDIYNEEKIVFNDTVDYSGGTYDLVSKIAYLIGVPKNIFENEYEPPKMEIYNQLERDKNARIIRHLCIIRTAIERKFKFINEKMRMDFQGFFSMPEYIPAESIHQLTEDGVNFIKKSNIKLNQHIMEINRIISDRINNCKYLFPIWLNWQYIHDLFIMPNGLTEAGTKEAAALYYSARSYYPYQMYINWTPRDEGNILYNDKKFAILLYQWHDNYFTELSKVSDASSYIKGNIYSFIHASEKIVLAVDCENSDPYKLCATLQNLEQQYISKISLIVLFDDIHTASAWQILEEFTDIPVDRKLIGRVKEDKSLVDMRLALRVSEEFYRNNVDSFIIVSSDSDFYGLISSLPDARFLFMVEREKCGPDMKKALVESGIFYCFIDDFYSGNSEDLKLNALFKVMNQYLRNSIHLNVNDMFSEALHTTRLPMSTAERRQFYEKHIRNMSLVIDKEGNVSIELKRS